MDLNYDDATREFREEVRDFLAANKASFPTKSCSRSQITAASLSVWPVALQTFSRSLKDANTPACNGPTWWHRYCKTSKKKDSLQPSARFVLNSIH